MFERVSSPAIQAALDESAQTEPRYSMDDATYSHLAVWCDRFASDPDAARVAIVEHLESLTVEDAEYSINHGWRHVWSLIDPARS